MTLALSLLRLPILPFSFLVLALITKLPYKLRPIFYVPYATRIGHFWPSFLLLRLDIKLHQLQRPVFAFIPNKTCNSALRTIIARELTILPYLLYRFISPFRYWKIFSGLYISERIQDTKDLAHLVPPPPFTSIETQQCHHWYSRRNIDLNCSRLICLFSRDGTYLKKSMPAVDFSYHNYRNVDPTDYDKSILWLLAQDPNNIVLRMGNQAQKPCSVQHPRFIDYPFIEDQHPLIEIYTIAQAALIISPGTGPDNVAHFYGTPLLYVNFLPYDRMFDYINYRALVIPKTVLDSNREKLDVAHNILHSYGEHQSYLDRNLHIQNLSDNQILNAVIKAYDHFIMKKPIDDNDLRESSALIEAASEWMEIPDRPRRAIFKVY